MPRSLSLGAGVVLASLLVAPACGGDPHGGVVAPVTNGGATPQLRVGDYVVYRFSGSFSDKPVTLREEVVAKDSGRVTLDVRATRGHEERRWIQVGPDTGDARWSNRVDELYVVREGGAKQRLPNPENATLARLYEWIVVGADGEVAGRESAPCEKTIASTRYACTCERASFSGRRTIKSEEARCSGFVWQRGPATWTTQDGGVLWQVEVVEASAPQ